MKATEKMKTVKRASQEKKKNAHKRSRRIGCQRCNLTHTKKKKGSMTIILCIFKKKKENNNSLVVNWKIKQ